VTLVRTSTAVKKVLVAWPLIGVLAVFGAVGLSVYLAYQARQASKANGQAITGQLASKDALIKSKDDQITDLQRQLAAKDVAIVAQTSIIGQLYNGAVALQQQVTSLGGQPKTLPIKIPSAPTALVPGVSSTVPPGAASSPQAKAPASSPPPVAPAPSVSPAVNLQIPCLPICPPKRG
jgi:hypothetical protein